MRTDSSPTAVRRATLTKWGGWSSVAIGLGHSVLGLVMGGEHVPGWLTGALHWGLGNESVLASSVTYWSVPAGFPVPLILLGLLAVGRARTGRALPRYVGWTLLAWAAFNLYVGFPNGYILVFAPAVLFLIDSHRSGSIPSGSRGQ